MSKLVMVRHGQASFLADDYDQLSSIGFQQAAALADYWLESDEHFTHAIVGPCLRHRQTAEVIQERYAKADRRFPELQMSVAFDEHHVDQMLTSRPDQLRRDPRTKDLVVDFEQANEEAARHTAFQRLFERAAEVWLAGGDFGVESWLAFQARVQHGVEQISHDCTSGSCVALFSSVGPISVTLQKAMRCNDDVTLQTGWRVMNCSLSTFMFSGSRFTLDCFNSVPHLHHSLRTYR